VSEKANASAESQPQFGVSCDAGDSGSFAVRTNSLTVTAALQVTRRNGRGMQETVQIVSSTEKDGSVALRVLIFHPDWADYLQIACLRSRQDSGTNAGPLEYDLEHKHLQ
jgi:hypothetical protein